MPFNSHHWATPIFLILFNYLSLYLSINLSIFLPIHISITVSVYLSITISICQSINQYSIAADPGARNRLVSLHFLTVEIGKVGRHWYNILYNVILWKDGFWTWKRYLIENCYVWKLFQLHLAVQHRHESLLLGLISRHLLSNARQVQSHVWQESRYLQVKHSFAKFMFQIDPSLTPSLVPERWYRTSANNLSTFEAIYKYF